MPTQRSKPTLNFRPCRTDAELAAYARLTSLAFGRTQSDAADWLKARKPQDIRILTHAPRTRSTPERTPLVLHGVEIDPRVCAGLITIPMGQYFGGVPIPLTGVAAVSSGYLSPIQLAQVGQVRAPAAAIASLASIFAPAHGPPSMSEMY
ncbi:MAG TPA: hypothetical protein PL072_05325 [Phycisphaerales bacterium]|nr:hypothetical protein [Phycisphaerales bacterium]